MQLSEMASEIFMFDHGIDSVIFVLIVLVLFFLYLVKNVNSRPEITNPLEILVVILILLFSSILLHIVPENPHDIFIGDDFSQIIIAIQIVPWIPIVFCVLHLIFIAIPYCSRKIIKPMQDLYNNVNFVLERFGAKRPEGYEIFSCQKMDIEIEFWNEECPICLMKFLKKDKCAMLDNCGHTFHHGCLHQCLALSKCCPLCRRSIKD